MVNLITPLANNVPIVRPDGTPTPYFARLLQELSKARVSASLIEAMGGDPGSDQIVTWDDSDGDLDFKSLSDVLDFIGSAAHGDILYRDSANWARLAAGTDGHFLKTQGAGADPTWAAVSAGGDCSLIERVDFTGADVPLITSFAGLGLAKVMFIFSSRFSTDDTAPTFRYRLNGVTKTDGNYLNTADARSSAANTQTEDAATATTIRLTDLTAAWGVGNATGETISSVVTILDPDSTTKFKIARVESDYIAPSGSLVKFDGAGTYVGTDATSALQGVDFGTSPGTLTGSIWVYGFAGS